MPESEQSPWRPPTSSKQDFLRETCLGPKRYVLANGCRFSTKTVGCLHAFTENAWLTRRGNSSIITISQTVGVDSGIWKDLTEVIIPQWIEGDFGLEWHREPYTMGVSKRPTCEIVNRYGVDLSPAERKKVGGTTIIQLESLKDENEVENRFKPRRYSCMYVPELSSFTKLKTFLTWTECLRLLGLPSEEHLFLADTNPSDEGSESWIYKLWFELMNAREDEFPDLTGGEEDSDIPPDQLRNLLGPLKKNLARVDFDLGDNKFDTKERIDLLISKYALDPDLYARYVKGQWVTASEKAIFYTTFRPHFHVIGELETPAFPYPEIMVPERNCIELSAGMDPGEGINSAAVIGEKAVFREETGGQDASGNELPPKQIIGIKFLDELVVVGEVHSLEDFTIAFMRKMQFWEEEMDRPGKVIWKFWSDRSVFESLSVDSGRYYHQIIYDASVKAIEKKIVNVSCPIVLTAAERGPGSVQQRISLWKMLLFDERALFSASKTPKLIEANKSLKKGTTVNQPVQKGSIHKHPWDAGSYLAASELYEEMQDRVIQNLLRQRDANRKSQGSLVSVPL